MVYQGGVQMVSGLSGTERVAIDTGGGGNTETTTQALANLSSTFGSGGSAMPPEGNIFRQISAAGISPGSTGNDNVLAVFSLPANSFDVSGRGIAITANGNFASNGNTKDVKIIFNPSTAIVGSAVGSGGTTVCDSGAVTTSGGGWVVTGEVFKYGAAGSNTQICVNAGSIAGSSHLGTSAPATATATESSAILVAITGNATTTASDITLNFCEINAMN